MFLVEYPGDGEIATEKVDEYDSGETDGERYVEYGMYEHGEYKPVEKCLYIGEYFRQCGIGKKCPGKVESYDDTADDMGQEGEYGSEYPGREHSGTPESGLFRYVFEVKDILYETEAERDEYREKHSFLDGIDERERAREDTEMFAGLFYDGDDQIVEKHEFQRSEYHSGDGDSPVRERCLEYIETEEQEMEKGE